jgi:zinc protease
MRARRFIAISIAAIVAAGCSAADSQVSVEGARPVDTGPRSTQPDPTLPDITLDPPSTAPDDTTPDGTTPATPPPTTSPTESDIPVDSQVKIGTLDNGMRYYIRANNRPGAQAELRMAINAGSGLENDDQSAVAHFLEHMLFNGTEKYPKNELITELQKHGSEFGADINAYTSYDETVYQLNVPNDRTSFETGLDIMHQWLTAATIDEKEVVAERGVVLDEWRRSQQSAFGRVFVEIEKSFLEGTGYADRSPIGTSDAIESMTGDLLRRYYDAWYRPDNAALVVVGDIDVDEVEDQVRELFGTATARGEAQPRKALTWTAPSAPKVVVVGDPDLTKHYTELLLPAPSAAVETATSVGSDVITAIGFDIIANRLADDVTRGGAPFNEAEASSADVVRAFDAPSISLTSSNDSAGETYEAILDEFARVVQFGFGDGEVKRSVDSFRAQVEAGHDASDTVQDAVYADAYVANFLTGDAIADADTTYELVTSILDQADAGLVSEVFQSRLNQAPAHLVLAGGSDASGVPAAADAIAALSALGRRAVEPREDLTAGAKALMERPTFTDQGTIDDYPGESGIYLEPKIITFKNGARVIVNANTIAEDRVSLFATSPGGLAAAADEDVAEVWLMNEVVTQSGFGDLDAVQVAQILSASTAQVTPFPSFSEEYFTGGSSKQELELSMQLLHQYFVAPRFTQAALDNALDRNRSTMEDVNADPGLAAQLAQDVARYGDSPRHRSMLTLKELDTVDLADMQRVWTERFGNASDFTFVFSGDLDMDEATELARAYIGTLPGTGKTEQRLDTVPPPPEGVVTEAVRAGTGEKASLSVRFNEPSDATAQEDVYAELLGAVVSKRLTTHIREELGASYSPSARTFVTDEISGEVVTMVSISGAPDDMERIATVLQQDLADLRANGPSDDEFEGSVAELDQSYGYVSNDVLVQVVTASLTNDDAIRDYVQRSAVLGDISKSELQAFALRVLPEGQYIQITQLPR